ncbi:MAG: hypothetical protein AAF487_10730, partial [Bacteroidota bacterium]
MSLSFCFGQKEQKRADEFFKGQNYLGALPLYEKLLAEDSLNAENAIKAAKCILSTNMDRTLAIPILEKLTNNKIHNQEAIYLLAKALTFDYNFEKSTFLIEKHNALFSEELKPKVNILKKNNATAKILMNNPVDVS